VRVDFRSGICAPSTRIWAKRSFRSEGTLEYQIDGKAGALSPGDVLFVPQERSTGEELARATGRAREYVVEKGKPLITLVSERQRVDQSR